MGRIEELADIYRRHIATQWQRTIPGAQRVLMVVYDKELERTLRSRKDSFKLATEQAGHDWHEIDISSWFAEWMASDEYCEEYFKSPNALTLKVNTEFPMFVAERIRETLCSAEVSDQSVVGMLGAATLFGFTHLSEVIKMVERDIKGRLLVFFPGHLDGNNYRLLDARDSWNYLAVPITLHSEGGSNT